MVPGVHETLESVRHRDQGIDRQGQGEHSEEELEVPNPLFHNLNLIGNMLDEDGIGTTENANSKTNGIMLAHALQVSELFGFVYFVIPRAR